MSDITKIVVTGGPCAGKSTAMSWIQNAFAKKGYTVLFVPETATELIIGGVAPWTCGSPLDFQKVLLRLQLEKEKAFERAAATMTGKVLIVCDRGVMDNRAYTGEPGFAAILREYGYNEVELRDDYGAVFHLVTAARGAEEFYTTANNAARTETVEEARALDDRIISAWTGHPHFRVIDNATDFEEKMKRLIAEIASFLGEPEPLEIERKFLVEYPDIRWLENEPNCRRVEIVQTYLRSDGDEEVRVRRRGAEGHYIYFKTVKKKLSGARRVEIESRLSRQEYLSLLADAGNVVGQICKTRYCLTYKSQYFEIDVYPFWKDRAVAEIELREEGMAIEFPPELKLIREVTDDDAYKNSSLARSQTARRSVRTEK